jgi:GT2 family glycosyltransferase
MSALPTITIVMPAYNASEFVKKTVPAALRAAAGARLLVVDPGSTDDTAAVARALGAEVVRLPERAGPALARNRGVHDVDSEVVLFIDSDCLAQEDVVQRVQRAFAEDPQLMTLSGSYDDAPHEPNFFSMYMNLRHHVTHQLANRERAGFWAGCGAVRRAAFVELGGFDVATYPMPMIEDIELGLRMAQLGRCKLDPEMQVKHLKRWSMRGVIETDIKSRAIPWARLILQTGALPNDLNLRWQQRLAAALSPLVLLGFLALPLSLAVGQWSVALASACVMGVSLVLHAEMLGRLRRIRGLPFTLAFWAFHQVHLLYSAATLAILTALHVTGPGKKAVDGGA